MKKYEKIEAKLIQKAKQANLINLLRSNHPDTIHYAKHPTAQEYPCWRHKQYDSLVFYTKHDGQGNKIYQYHRWSNHDIDDGITYLVKYENYSWPSAAKALAYFVDTLDD